MLREIFGRNEYPESPLVPYWTLLLDALSDTTLLVLLGAAAISLCIGIWQDGPEHGWVEGGSIFIAVFLVANISAGNDYSKQLQFIALENSAASDERASVLREGVIERIHTSDIVVGDVVVLQAGDQIPADCLLFDNNVIMCSQASLTGNTHIYIYMYTQRTHNTTHTHTQHTHTHNAHTHTRNAHTHTQCTPYIYRRSGRCEEEQRQGLCRL